MHVPSRKPPKITPGRGEKLPLKLFAGAKDPNAQSADGAETLGGKSPSLIGKSTVNGPVSMAMSVYQRVQIISKCMS